jgi:RNA polymerase-binding transcription factor DksA
MTDPRDVLAQQRAEVEAAIADLSGNLDAVKAANADANIDDEHDPEGATTAFEREQLAASLDRARAQLEELDAAEQRACTGRYGVCENCGRPISAERLEALPATRWCLDCAGRRR